MTLKSAYKGGWRAGATVRFEVINGLKYMKKPMCPFHWWQPIRWMLWHEGEFEGLFQRVTSKGIL